MKLPNFIVIGAPKSGTTSLYNYLKQHPDIFLPVRKELHYFSYDLIQDNLNGPGDTFVLPSLCATKDDYISHYRTVGNESAIGEVSPSYLYYHQVSQNIFDELGSVKIIILLRNPVNKALSQYMHMVRENREKLKFTEALLEEDKRRKAKWSDLWFYASSSLYSEGTRNYISLFGRENVKIIISEEFFSDPQSTMHELFDFLDVDASFPSNTRTQYNRTGKPRSGIFANFLARPNLVKSMFKTIVPESIRIPIRYALMDLNTGGKISLEQDTKAYLEGYFVEDIHNLERIIGRSTNWVTVSS